MPDFNVREAAADERADVLAFLFRNDPSAERQGRIARTQEAIARGEIVPPSLLFARDAAGELLGVIVCQAIPGGNAVIWPPQALGGDDVAAVEARRPACERSARSSALSASPSGRTTLTRLR